MNQLLDTIINGPAHYATQHQLSPGITLLVVLGALVIELVIAYAIVRLIIRSIQNLPSLVGFVLRVCGVDGKEVPHTFLELTFPADTSKSAFATEQLHILLRNQPKHTHIWDKLAARKRPYSLELASTRDGGIRYMMRVPVAHSAYIEQSLRSYLPGLKIRPVKDYLAAYVGVPAAVVELQLTADFALPLASHTTLKEHDLFAYITGHMTKLSKDELMAYQITLNPISTIAHRRVLRRIRKLQARIKHGKTLSTELTAQRSSLGHALWLLWYPPLWCLMAASKTIAGCFDILTSMFSKEHDLPAFLNSNKDKRRSGDPYELELGKQMKAKLDQHLFEVSIRLLVSGSSAETIEQRLGALVATFQPFASSYQALQPTKPLQVFNPADRALSKFRRRVLTPHVMSQPTILSSSELSDLYHFPETDITKTEGLVKSRSRELPTPLSIKRSDSNLDVIVGVNKHGGDEQPIGLTLAQRQKHTYIIGKTGTGKTTMLTNAIYQDMVNGKGLAVLDPHGDMFQELLRIVPEHRRKDVVVFDPSDRDWPIGLNILDPGIAFTNEDDKQDWITSSVVSVFMKLADEQQWGPRMEHILRNTTLTALQLPNPSLYTMQRLLTDKKYQKEVAAGLTDPVLKQFWQKEFNLLGSMQLANASGPLTHRLGHFITTKMTRHILLQQKTSLRIADIMNEGKILLVNLAKGDIGEDQSLFFGTILTSLVWMAAYQRTKIPEKQRKDFFLYIDEFQNFATPQFSEIISEGRKFHISLILSHQNIAQIEDKNLVKLIAGNASTLITLKVGHEDETFMLPYMKPEVTKGDMVNLAPYHFYIKTTADESEDAFSGETVPLEVEDLNDPSKEVRAESRKRYGTPKAKVETYLEKLIGTSAQVKKDKPIKAKGTKVKTGNNKKVHGV